MVGLGFFHVDLGLGGDCANYLRTLLQSIAYGKCLFAIYIYIYSIIRFFLIA